MHARKKSTLGSGVEPPWGGLRPPRVGANDFSKFSKSLQEIKRREKELDATVRRPAEAEKYRLEKIAEAEKQKVILEAQAEAEAVRVSEICFSFFVNFEVEKI